jgi:predicted nucleic-acid-binding protein
LRTFDKPIETSDIIMIGVEGKNKGNYLANVVLSKYENIKEIELYDDSQGNIDDMIQIKKELESIDRQIKFDIYLVKHGKPELVSN